MEAIRRVVTLDAKENYIFLALPPLFLSSTLCCSFMHYVFCYNNAEIIGEVTILYQGEAIDLDWEDHGFRLYLPDNALPHGVTSCCIQIKAFLSCEYVIPDDAGKADLVSGIYHISSTHSFTKPVTLCIQHFSRNTESLCFGINSDLKYPYKFNLVKGDSIDSSYCAISVTSFSIFSIIRRMFGDMSPEQKYCSHLLYSTAIRYRDSLEWNVYFLIINDSDLYYTVNYNYNVHLKATAKYETIHGFNSEVIFSI